MTARDDYPASIDMGGDFIELRSIHYTAMCDEIDRLRGEIARIELRISQSNSSVKIFKPPYRSRGNQ